MSSAFLSGKNYLALPADPQPWIIKNLIPVGGLTNLFGRPKTGKSFAALGMAHAISQEQEDWLGFPVLRHGPVAYLQIDTPRGLWQHEYLKPMEDKGLDTSRIFICDSLMTKDYPFNVLDFENKQAAWLKAQLDEVQPLVVFIDTLREAHAGDENDSTVMRNVITSLVAACRPAAVVFLSHSKKLTGENIGADDIMTEGRGSSYVSGRMDCILKLTEHFLNYKGRSPGKGAISIEQVEGGLLQLNGKDAAYSTLIRTRVMEMRSELPTISVNAMATQLATETSHRKLNTIRADIVGYLESSGLQVKIRKGKK